MKIKVTDNRVLIGKFMCTDRDSNLILNNTEEFLTENKDETPRQVGMVMIPGEHIKFIKIANSKPGRLTPMDGLMITGKSIDASGVQALESLYGDKPNLEFL